MQRAHALAEQLAAQAPLTMRAGKEIVRRMRDRFAGVEDEDLIALCYGSADFREGLEAFLAKRAPRFTGALGANGVRPSGSDTIAPPVLASVTRGEIVWRLRQPPYWPILPAGPIEARSARPGPDRFVRRGQGTSQLGHGSGDGRQCSGGVSKYRLGPIRRRSAPRSGTRRERFGNVWSLFVTLAEGPEIEFTFAERSWVKTDPPAPEVCRIVRDGVVDSS